MLNQINTPTLWFVLLLLSITNYSNAQLKLNLKAPEAYTVIDARKSNAANQQIYQGKKYLLLEFEVLPDPKLHDKLKAEGIDLLQYVPHNHYLAALPASSDLARLGNFGVKGIAYLNPDAKKIKGPASSAKSTTATYIFFTPDSQEQDILGIFAQHSITDYQHTPVSFLWRAKISEKQSDDLQQIPVVTWMEEVAEDYETLNIGNTTRHAANYVQHFNGLSGEDVVVGVGDLGIFDHIDGRNRVTNNYSTYGTHGNNVSGILAGAGNKDPRHKGFAPKSTLITDYFNNIITKTPVLHSSEGLVLTNNSYGVVNCAALGQYNVNAYLRDGQLYGYPEVMHVYAVGNSGSPVGDCSTLPYGYGSVLTGDQAAKNILTVGNLASDDELAYSSSKGPVQDGRIKPEICARGDGIITTGNNNAYNNFGGTSAAAPAVTGAMALLVEKYRSLYGNSNPRGELLKLLACNSADDLGNPGPDYSYGFGALNLRRAVDCIDEGRFIIGTIGHGQNQNYAIQVPAYTEELRVMLYWAEPSAAPFASSTLVNDLDLKVSDNQNETHLPLILDPQNPEQFAQNGIDRINNIEQVVIKKPSPGQFEVNLTGYSLPTGVSSFVIGYEFIKDETFLLNPLPNSVVLPEDEFVVYWDAWGNTLPFSLSYTLDNGNTWELIADNIAPKSRSFSWEVPNIASTQAKVKIERFGDSPILSGTFAIMEQPELEAFKYCNGAEVQLEWENVQGANSYDLFLLRENDAEMTFFTNVKGTDYLLHLAPADIGQEIWYAVQPVNAGGMRGLRSLGVTPLTDIYENPGAFHYLVDGLEVQFSGVANVPSNVINSFYWDFGDGTSAAQQNISHTYAIPGSYTVQMALSTMCGTAIKSQTIYISDETSCLVQDSLQLVNLYHQTDGPNWDNPWDLTTPIATWAGLAFTNNGCAVKEVNLRNAGLRGELTNLHLPSLVKLDLSYNQLTGTVPDYDLPLLKFLFLGDNHLIGQLPQFSNLNNLRTLSLPRNYLQGQIPALAFPVLAQLHLQENQFTGALPALNLPGIVNGNISYNKLTGNIPNYSFPNLTLFRLDHNKLEGNIPSFNNLTSVKYLYLNDNDLVGAVPSFSACSNLIYLYLENNKLTGSLPQFDQADLERLILDDNLLEGPLPDLDLPSLVYLQLANNKINERLPDFSALPALAFLELQNNEISGVIPPLQAPALKNLFLQGNQLSGGIPDLSNTNLNKLKVYDNKLVFDGMANNLANINVYEVAPQAKVPVYRSGDTLKVIAGSNLADYTFEWYRDGKLVSSLVGQDSYFASEGGRYFCKVKNAGLPTDTYRKFLVLNSEAIEVGRSPAIQLHVWLQGPYYSSLGKMAPQLYLDQVLPGQLGDPGHHYFKPPWNYQGTEGAFYDENDYVRVVDENQAQGIVDWVLVSFRKGVSEQSTIARAVGMLLDDGRIVFTHGNILPRGYSEPVYILVEHRNHIGAMTPGPVPIVDNELVFDFRLQDSYRTTTSFGSILLTQGQYGLIAGDGNQLQDNPSFSITGNDRLTWQTDNGIFQNYLLGDYNLDGDINGKDKIFWDLNNGLYSIVPRSR